ncbi:MAG: hypothetical protein IPK60_00830 [Sandaracinaceae bacterium]|nr:hypothetical protein [Sandaracinaceae bacterium]
MTRRWTLLCLIFGLTGCVSETPVALGAESSWVDEGNVEDGAFDGPGRPKNFIEVDAAHTSNAFRQYVNGALRVLATDTTEIGLLTWESIRAGRVRIDELADLTCSDFERVRNDFKDTALGLTASDYVHLHDSNSAALAKLSDAIYGYQWSNRIYITRGQSAEQLASTLVHEVNHVLNHSEQHYYDDLPTSGFIEEYRAFTAERRFRAARWEGTNMINYVCDNYDWDRDAIDAEVLSSPLSPQMLPSAANWSVRLVEDDPVDDERACLRSAAN